MPDSRQNLSPKIKRTLGRLRRVVRSYVIGEGVACAVIWIVFSFLVFWAIDYLPVYWFGRNELPYLMRLVYVIAISGVGLWVIYHWILARVTAKLGDRSLALLLERNFPEFDEALITAVDGDEARVNSVKSRLFQKTLAHAESTLDRINMPSVFDGGPSR